MNLEQTAKFYWLNGGNSVPMPFKTNYELRLYIYISKLRRLLIKQELIWVPTEKSLTLFRIQNVLKKLSLALEYLKLSQEQGYHYFVRSIIQFDSITNQAIEKCFYVPRGRNFTSKNKQFVQRSKIECKKLLEHRFTLTYTEKLEIQVIINLTQFTAQLNPDLLQTPQLTPPNSLSV